MFQVIRNTSIKMALNVPIMLLSFLLIGSSLWVVFTIYLPNTIIADNVGKSNQLADHLLSAAASEAQERGFTASLLSKLEQGSTNSAMFEKIKAQRITGDDNLSKALALADELIAAGWKSKALRTHKERIRNYKSDIISLRAKVDKAFMAGPVPDKGLWIQSITKLILATSDLRLSAFTSYDDVSDVIYNNNMIKQALWTIAEYSGRERAALGQATSTNSPLTTQAYSTLMGYKAIVDTQMDYLKTVANHLDMSKEYQQKWRQIEKIYLGRFQVLRKEIYQVSAQGNYPVNGQEWLRQSTAAINTLFALGDVLGAEGKLEAKAVRFKSQWQLLVSSSIALSAVFIAIALMMYIFRLTKQMTEMRDYITTVEKSNDLQSRSSTYGSNELGQINDAFNSVLSRISTIVKEVTRRTSHTIGSVATVVESSEETSHGTQAQNKDLETVAAAIHEMSITVQQVAQSTTVTAEAAKNANDGAIDGQMIIDKTASSIFALSSKVEEAGHAIIQLEKDSSEINQVLNVINDIAEQTNLLALNAAIEAARAGEQGRGFSVVADEVRALAKRTHDSTNEIFSIIDHIQKQMKISVSLIQEVSSYVTLTVEESNNARDALENIVEKVNTITDMSAQIATGAEEQSCATEEISRSIANISSISQGTSAGAIVTSDACETIGEQMEHLRQLVSQFKVGNSLDLTNAKSAHLAWKGRIFSFLHGKESLSLAQAVSHRDCVLGKWYYSEGLQKFGNIPEMRLLEKPHEELHKLIKQIITLKNEGKNAKAEEMAHRIDPISKQIVSMLDTIEVAAEQLNAT